MGRDLDAESVGPEFLIDKSDAVTTGHGEVNGTSLSADLRGSPRSPESCRIATEYSDWHEYRDECEALHD